MRARGCVVLVVVYKCSRPAEPLLRQPLKDRKGGRGTAEVAHLVPGALCFGSFQVAWRWQWWAPGLVIGCQEGHALMDGWEGNVLADAL